MERGGAGVGCRKMFGCEVISLKSELRNEYLVLLCLMLLTPLIVSLNQNFVPDRYYFDARAIDNIASSMIITEVEVTSQTHAVAKFYSFFKRVGVDLMAIPFATLILLISFSALLWLRYSLKVTQVNIYGFVLFNVWCFILMIYYGQPNKEIFGFLSLAMALLACLHFKRSLAVSVFIGILVPFAIWLRPHWFVVFPLLLILFFINRSTFKPVKSLFSIFGYCLFLSSASLMIFGRYFSDFRMTLISGREGGKDSATLIQNILSVDSIPLDTLNLFFGFFRFVMPVELIISGKSLYFVSGSLILLSFVAIYAVVSRALKMQNISSKDRKFALIIFSFITSYIFMLSTYEPDFGSYLKHLLILMPFYYPLAYIHMSSKRVNDGQNCSYC